MNATKTSTTAEELFAEQWAKFQKDVVPKGLTPAQLSCFRATYYCAGAALLALLLKHKEDPDALARIGHELHEFIEAPEALLPAMNGGVN